MSERSPSSSFSKGWWIVWTFSSAFLLALLITRIPVFIDLSEQGVVFASLGITDIGRDLLGASVVEQGGVPYDQIGNLLEKYSSPELPLSGPARSTGWVVHPPLALAGARGLLVAFGGDAEIAARRLGFACTGGLAVSLLVLVWRSKRLWAVPVVLAVLTWVPTFTDTVWIQWNALAGLGMLAVVLLDEHGRRTPALVLLGLLVAWKPWLAVFALAMPRSSSVLKDSALVAGTAVLATLAALPWVGGVESLEVWVTEALPGNTVEARTTAANLSWTSSFSPGWATVVYIGSALLIAVSRHRVPRKFWLLLPVAVATLLAPFVWDHYWLALAPIVFITWVRSESDMRYAVAGWLSLAVLPVVLSMLGRPGLEYRVLPMVLAGAILFMGVLAVAVSRRSSRSGGVASD